MRRAPQSVLAAMQRTGQLCERYREGVREFGDTDAATVARWVRLGASDLIAGGCKAAASETQSVDVTDASAVFGRTLVRPAGVPRPCSSVHVLRGRPLV